MADIQEQEEDNVPRSGEENEVLSEDEQDVHYCGKCKLSFTDLSKYIKHKSDKLCRDVHSKGSLKKVVEKLPIQNTPASSEQSQEEVSKTYENVGVDDTETDGDEKEQVGSPQDSSSAAERVEVQFLEPLVSSGSEVTEKPKHRRKRKSSTPKTTRKRKSSSTSSQVSTGNEKELACKASHNHIDSVTVHIPESQLVHLNSGSRKSPATPQGTGVRKQGATSVFVPIYLTPPMKNFQCFRCPAEFKSKEEKEEHGKMHKKEFRCPLCSKSFFTANGFEQHRANESHSHPCDACGKVFSSVANLRRHKTTHSTDRPYGCDQCDKCFCSPANLRSHKRTVHVTEKKHKCPECGKAFSRRDKMRRHSLIHYPDTRPTFVCPFRSHTGCMKTFYREDKLKRHLFTHSKDKPFKCELCNKGYARRDNLNDHMRSHTGQYSHLCSVCNKGFLGPHKLRKHLKSAHKDKWSPNLSVDPLDSQPPTMVPRNTVPSSKGIGDNSPPTSPEALSDEGDDEAFDMSGSGSAEEPTSDEEQSRNEEELARKPPTPAKSPLRPLPTPQARARPVPIPDASTRRVSSSLSTPDANCPHPITTSPPQVGICSGNTPQVTCRPGSATLVPTRLMPNPQVSARPMPALQVNARPVSSPQATTHSLPTPLLYVRPALNIPESSGHPLPAIPQLSARPRPIQQVGPHPEAIPQISARSDTIPPLTSRQGPLPQIRARPIPVSQVGGAPGPFINPPLQSSLNPSTELLAFAHDLFPVVGRYQ